MIKVNIERESNVWVIKEGEEVKEVIEWGEIVEKIKKWEEEGEEVNDIWDKVRSITDKEIKFKRINSGVILYSEYRIDSWLDEKNIKREKLERWGLIIYVIVNKEPGGIREIIKKLESDFYIQEILN